MLVAFTDVGSAWNGKIPITRKGSIIFINYEETPLKLMWPTMQVRGWTSCGFGLRTALLGYYLKIDYARPIEDLS